MKTLIIGAGPLGSLYTYLFHKAKHDVTLLARNEHFKYLKKNGITLVNEFTYERINDHVKVTNTLSENDSYDLAIVLMRKNNVTALPVTRSGKLTGIITIDDIHRVYLATGK